MVGVVEENEGRTLGQPVSAGSVTLFPHAMVQYGAHRVSQHTPRSDPLPV